MAGRGNQRIEALTGLRIFAALAVFLSHLRPFDGMNPLVANFMASGYNGVTLFFVLSGFVLAWNYFDKLVTFSRRNIYSFAVARIARIYPLYLAALLFAAWPSLVSGEVQAWWVLHVLALQAWSPDLAVAYGLNPPAWSIGIEFFLYAAFPLLVVGMGRATTTPKRLLLVALAAVASLAIVTGLLVLAHADSLPWQDAWSAHRWLYRTPLTRLTDFVVGMVAALLVRRARVPVRWGSLAQACGIVLFVVIMSSPSVLFTAWSWDIAYVVPSGLLLWGLAWSPGTPVGRLLASRPMVFAGEASFAFYLFHRPLIQIFSSHPTDVARWWLEAVGLFVVVFAVSAGAHILIERPAQRWLRSRLDRPGLDVARATA